ncbi:hypothetical protein C2W62_26730 [Candidatus Entotheonella serta]|nr:hypothetical protein C2W62_26730 [Candidatus Entotheonella serta]
MKSDINTAEGVSQRHAQTINERDVEAYCQTMNFPFTYQNYNGVALTLEAVEEVGVTAPLPWDIILGTDPNWHHTDFDFMEEVARSASSVVFKVGFSRVDATGHAYGSYHAIWIATCQNGRWGVQFRHNLGLRDS